MGLLESNDSYLLKQYNPTPDVALHATSPQEGKEERGVWQPCIQQVIPVPKGRAKDQT